MEPAAFPDPVRAAHRLRTVVLTLLLADAVLAWVVVIGVFTLLQRFWLGGADRTLPGAVATHVAQLEVARRLQGLVVLATAAAFVAWVGAAQRALVRLGVPRLRFSAGAAMAAFVLPVINLVVPVRVVSELWRASRLEDPQGPPWWETPGPALVPLWWALVVGAQLVDPVWRPLLGGVETLAVGGSTLLFVLGQLAAVAGAVLGVVIVWTIDARQARHVAHEAP